MNENNELSQILDNIQKSRELMVDIIFKLDYDRDYLLYLLVHDCMDLLYILRFHILSDMKNKE